MVYGKNSLIQQVYARFKLKKKNNLNNSCKIFNQKLNGTCLSEETRN